MLGGSGLVLLLVAAARIFTFIHDGQYVPGNLDVPSTKLALLGTALSVIGAQIVFSSFFLGLFSIEPVSDDGRGSAELEVSLPLNLVPLRTSPSAPAARVA